EEEQSLKQDSYDLYLYQNNYNTKKSHRKGDLIYEIKVLLFDYILPAGKGNCHKRQFRAFRVAKASKWETHFK
ncbi:MAG: hypothetical protein IJA89_04865, partial [Clostridia bacterium]|nr:hypothetical protein [Clostridia bacterium]